MSVFDTLGDLRQAVAEEVMRANHRGFAEAFHRMVKFAENRIVNGSARPFETQAFRVPEMEATIDPLIFIDGVAEKPTDLLEPIQVTWDGEGVVPAITIEGNSIYISPADTVDLVLTYYARPAALSADDDSNAVLLAYPDLYFQAVLIEAYGYTRDAERKAEALAAFAAVLGGIHLTSWKRKAGAAPLYPRIRNAWVRA